MFRLVLIVDALIITCKYSCKKATLSQFRNVYSIFIANAVLTAHMNPRGSVIRPSIPAKKAVSFVVCI